MIDIAVLGANGFVGSAICVELEKKKKKNKKIKNNKRRKKTKDKNN